MVLRFPIRLGSSQVVLWMRRQWAESVVNDILLLLGGWRCQFFFLYLFVPILLFFFLNRGEFCWKNSCHEERGCSLIFIKLKIWVWEREWNHLMTWTLKRGKVQINPFCCSLNIPFFFFLYRPSSFYSLLFFFLFST